MEWIDTWKCWIVMVLKDPHTVSQSLGVGVWFIKVKGSMRRWNLDWNQNNQIKLTQSLGRRKIHWEASSKPWHDKNRKKPGTWDWYRKGRDWLEKRRKVQENREWKLEFIGNWHEINSMSVELALVWLKENIWKGIHCVNTFCDFFWYIGTKGRDVWKQAKALNQH